MKLGLSLSPPTPLPPDLFLNIIKGWRGLGRVPPKRKENTPCFRASPPKRGASPPGIPSESPCESPCEFPSALRHPQAKAKKRGGPRNLQRIPPALSPFPNQGVHVGVRRGSTCGGMTAASMCLFWIPQTTATLTWATGPRQSYALTRGAGQAPPYTSHAHCTSR